MKNTKKLALLGILTATAMMLSYIEFLIPPIYSAVPGIKLGLANIAVIFALYSLDRIVEGEMAALLDALREHDLDDRIKVALTSKGGK